jgi:hypothetical protein
VDDGERKGPESEGEWAALCTYLKFFQLNRMEFRGGSQEAWCNRRSRKSHLRTRLSCITMELRRQDLEIDEAIILGIVLYFVILEALLHIN